MNYKEEIKMENTQKDEIEELKPCPFCGNEFPVEYITWDAAVLKCKCGATFEHAAVRVMYKKDELPKELEPYTYEPTLLYLRTKDGKLIPATELGYVGVNVMAAFWFAGITQKWNRRVKEVPNDSQTNTGSLKERNPGS